MQQAMFPGTTYENVSGGDPKFITDLTHQQLLDFHNKHYNPSNARFYTYGKREGKRVLKRMCVESLFIHTEFNN